MKNPIKKLQLNKETIAQLSFSELASVRGGMAIEWDGEDFDAKKKKKKKEEPAFSKGYCKTRVLCVDLSNKTCYGPCLPTASICKF